ncbi:FMN-binding protein [Flammeovirga agarivorans]|uniref:4Fe-4S binding protein n=1 Tax=Flammeovirga agarivorans TaxID=2726742 RepID=A0A7X8SGT5_9BACT|nr:FMN-binding protein [Flammeovirga agarivorans]NLR89858.1 4Fe-4S binding protein [Flammeovirga agarivorans]
MQLKIDYRKSGITLLIFGAFAYFAIYGPLDREDLHQNISTIENEHFAPKLVADFERKTTKEAGLISEGKSYVLGEYGLVRAIPKNVVREAGMISFSNDMGESLHNKEWANDMSGRLKEKYGDDAEVVIKLHGDLCYAEIYQSGRLRSLYFENMMHNTVQGFSGPIYMGIESSLGGSVREVSYITSKETESYLRKVLRSGYLDQYKNLNIGDSDHQINAISGATITTKAMADGVTEAFHVTAPQVLATYYDFDVDAFGVKAELTYWWIVHIIVITGIFAFAMIPQIKKTKKSRLAVSIFTMAYIGFGMNSSFTYITYLMPFMGTEVSLFLTIYALLTLLSAVWGKNAYCSYVCPFGAAQMITLKYSPFKSKKLFITNKQAEYIRYIVTLVLFVGFVIGYKEFGNFELFPDLFSTEISSYWFYISLAFIAISVKYPMLWCRVACPTGCVLDAVKNASEKKVKRGPIKKAPMKRPLRA